MIFFPCRSLRLPGEEEEEERPDEVIFHFPEYDPLVSLHVMYSNS